MSEAAHPELIVVAHPDAGLSAAEPTPAPSATSGDVDTGALAAILQGAGAAIGALLPAPSSDEQRTAESQPMAMPDLSVFFKVEAPHEQLEDLAGRLLEQGGIEGAFVKPPVQLPETVMATPDFTDQQGYRGAAPEGIDIAAAQALPGGDGSGVTIIDIEGGWCFVHEDLAQASGGLLAGTMINDANPLAWRDHGTAVLGVLGGDEGPFGVTGLVPAATLSAVSHGTIGSAAAIREATKHLQPGDVLLLEMHRPGPRHGFALRDDQHGYIAVEWWPDDFAAIQFAVSQGIVVVEAAGNGAQDLDDRIYDQRPHGFPASWTNPFRRHHADCGAIIVGAGAPPSGTHGPDRSRLDFSNFGLCVDAQGWGREVVTTGYGDLHGDTEERRYTAAFSGTSSASPIVTGAVAALEGIARAGGQAVAPWQARQLLRAYGSHQTDEPTRPATQRIGKRPDLAQAVPALSQPGYLALTKLAEEQWGLGWSHLRGVQFEDAGWVLGYKTNDYVDADGQQQLGGGVFFARVADEGTTCTSAFETSWSKGWTHMEPLYLGSGVHLLSYKRGVEGINASIDRFEPGGTATTSTWTGQWQTDWRDIVPTALGGVPHVLFYGAQENLVKWYPVLDDGSGFGNLVREEHWWREWSHIRPVLVRGDWGVLCYSGGLGGVSIDAFDTAATDTVTFRERWQPTYSSIVPLWHDGRSYVLSHDRDAGTTFIDRVLDDGEGVETVGWDTLGTGWTDVVPVRTAVGSQLLTYDRTTGAVAWWKVG